MKKFKLIATIKEVKHLKNSLAGNPRYSILFEDEDGKTHEAKTVVNGSIAYRITSRMEGKKYNLILHYTKNYNLILSDFEEV